MKNLLIEGLIVERFKELISLEDGYSVGEILFTICRPKFLTGSPGVSNIDWLKRIKDDDILTSLEKAIKEAKASK